MKVAEQLRRFILSVFKPVAKTVSHWYIAFRRPKMNLRDVQEILMKIRPGDVLISRSAGEFTNWFIPGFWTHAALYAADHQVVEAVSPCVRIITLPEFLLSKDFVCVLRPTFADEVQKVSAIAFAKLQATNLVPYDYQFAPTEKEFYCAELIGASYVYALDGKSPFTPRYTLGVLTYTPADFYNAIQKFELIWCKRDRSIPARDGLKKDL